MSAEREPYWTEAVCSIRCSTPKSVCKSLRMYMAEREGFEPSVQVLARTTV